MPFVKRRTFQLILRISLVVLAHSCAECAVPLPHFAVPSLFHLLRNNRMVKSAIIALHKPAKRSGFVFFPRSNVSAEPRKAHQHAVVVRQTAGWNLVPGC